MLDELFSAEEERQAGAFSSGKRSEGHSIAAAGYCLFKDNTFSKLHNLSTESITSLLGAVLAMIDVEYLAVNWEDEAGMGTFLTHVVARHLLMLSSRQVYKSVLLLFLLSF